MIKNSLIILFALISTLVLGQRGSISPYSIYGFGDEVAEQTVVQASMGGIGVALQEFNRLNFVNPASSAGLRVATYGLAGKTSFLKISSADSHQSNHNTSLQYIALGFPIGRKAGFSAGLQPVSTIGYSFSNSNNQNDVTITSRFRGSGGLNKLFGTFGIYLFEGFAIGVEGGFLFGNIDRSVFESKSDAFFSTKYEEKLTLRGGKIKVGLHYKKDLTKNVQLSSGVVFEVTDNIKAQGEKNLFSLQASSVNEGNPVQIVSNTSFTSSINNPLVVSAGFGLGKDDKWYVGLNSVYESAKDTPSEASYAYGEKMKTSLGGFYIPKINSISSYWNRVTYRAGVRYEKTGLLLAGTLSENDFTSIDDFGINVGIGLPLPKQISNLNLGFEYGQRGTTNNNLIKESYWNVRLSLSLNSLNWFKKRQID